MNERNKGKGGRGLKLGKGWMGKRLTICEEVWFGLVIGDDKNTG